MRRLAMRLVLTTALVVAIPLFVVAMGVSVCVMCVQSVREVWR